MRLTARKRLTESSAALFRQPTVSLSARPMWVLASFVITAFFASACIDSEPPRQTATSVALAKSFIVAEPETGRSGLRCDDCEPITVVRALSYDTVLTERGPFRLYGAFIAPESELCVAEGTSRFTELVGTTVRIEEGPRLFDGQGASVRYLYTESGDSIDELLISEGTARLSAFDGQHMPWLLFKADEARLERSGCIWEEFNQMFGGS